MHVSKSMEFTRMRKDIAAEIQVPPEEIWGRERRR
jgi:lambda repressor-like predicted transcriptional regulator